MNYIKLLNDFFDLIQSDQVSNSAQLLYHTLLMIDNKCNWTDWFSRTNSSLCGLMNVSEGTMKSARAELKQLGLIDFSPGKKKGQVTRYRILYFDTYSDTKADTYPDTQSDTKTDTQAVAIDKHKQKQKQKKSSTNVLPEKFSDDPALDNAVRAFMAYRKNIKSPMTAHAVELLLNKLETLAPGDPDTQVAIINQSIMNGWKGVFALKESRENLDTDYNEMLKGWANSE